MRLAPFFVLLSSAACRGPGTQAVMCPEGYTACGTECVDLQRNAQHCGACDHACGSSEECVAGMCQPLCGAGQHACNGVCVSNGDVAHCGAMCTPCPVPDGGLATCDGTRCGIICDPNLRPCSGVCAVCPPTGGTKCMGTMCVPSGCPKGQHLCNGECVEENGSSCGDGCIVCPAPPANGFSTCSSGNCDYLCRPGNRWCDAGCCRSDFMETGDFHSCALTPSGAVSCWGRNNLDGGRGGALGDGDFLDRTRPNPVTGLTSGIVAVQPGSFHTCAMDQFGAVTCWGYAGAGRLGDSSMSDKLTPMMVSGLGAGSAIAISAGGTGACALSRLGELRCWGDNANGEVGDGTMSPKTVPTLVSDLGSSVVDVSFGGAHACALMRGGTVRCWGANGRGQLGDATQVDRPRPVLVMGVFDAVRISAGERHTCAIRANGWLVCWGDNSDTQLGLPANEPFSAFPTRVAGVDAPLEVSAGGAHTCVRLSTGGLLCWGANESGQLGNDTTNPSPSPMPVMSISDATSISAGRSHTCARTQSGTRCWGNNEFGQLGDGSNMNRLTPVMAQ